MTRGQLFRWMQEKVDAEIGSKTTGEVSFRIVMYEGGIRRTEIQRIEKVKEIAVVPELRVVEKN